MLKLTGQRFEKPVPVMVAGWPGMGNVGLGACDYLRRQLDARPYARVDISGLATPEAIEVADGIGRIPPLPGHVLHIVEEPPLFLFEAEAQLPGPAGNAVARELLDFAAAHGVLTVYTGAAFATPMSICDESEVFGVATDSRLRNSFGAYGVKPLKEGRVSGLNGLLLGLAGARGLPAACFLATMPQYAVQTSNPRASRALVRVFERILNTSVDTAELDREVTEVDRLLTDFETRVGDAVRSFQERLAEQTGDRQEKQAPAEEEQLDPHVMMERIERLFEQVGRDRSLAPELKNELDRLGLFRLYEDRFLDLFDSSRGGRDPGRGPAGD